MFISIKFVGNYMRHPHTALQTPGCNDSISLSKTYHHTIREGKPSGIRDVKLCVGTMSVRLSAP